jgi:hypothetical protein
VFGVRRVAHSDRVAERPRVETLGDWIATLLARFGLRVPYQGGRRCLGPSLSPGHRGSSPMPD